MFPLKVSKALATTLPPTLFKIIVDIYKIYMLYFIYTKAIKMITPLQNFQEQINYYQNTINELEEAGKPVPKTYKNNLKLAQAAKKCWLNN